MIVGEALRWGIAQLKKAGVETPALDAELLLAHSAIRANRRIGRAWIVAHPEYQLSRAEIRSYKGLVARRVKREPVAYIVGHKEFYGLDFLINRRVLVPRPETEILVEQALDEIRKWKLAIGNLTLVDVGTGSGAIAVAVARECKMQNAKCKIIATDVSKEILAVARANARRHGVEKLITFLRSNLLEALPSNSRDRENLMVQPSAFIVVANLPYLTTAEWRATAPEIKKWEPRGALDGGKDGLKYYREMFEQFAHWLHNPSQPPLTLRRGDRSVPPLRVRGGEGELRVTVFCELCPHQIPGFKKIVRRLFSVAKFRVVEKYLVVVRI